MGWYNPVCPPQTRKGANHGEPEDRADLKHLFRQVNTNRALIYAFKPDGITTTQKRIVDHHYPILIIGEPTVNTLTMTMSPCSGVRVLSRNLPIPRIQSEFTFHKSFDLAAALLPSYTQHSCFLCVSHLGNYTFDILWVRTRALNWPGHTFKCRRALVPSTRD